MKILLTGASSFTGFWFALALRDAGHSVTALFTSPKDAYTGVRKERASLLEASGIERVWQAPMGSDGFLKVLDAGFDVFCHHGAQVRDYKSDDFDYLAAAADNTRNIQLVLDQLVRNGLQRVVLTGTVFEADEGAGEHPLRAFSPYGLSKTLTASIVRFWCERQGIPIGKFVIPNPFGPYEEARFTQYLLQTWSRGETATVRTPAYVRDNIHVCLLATCYVSFVEGHGHVMRPSGYVEAQGAFAHRVASAMRKRLGLPCDLRLQDQQEFTEPKVRINTDVAAALAPQWDEPAAWDALAEYYKTLLAL